MDNGTAVLWRHRFLLADTKLRIVRVLAKRMRHFLKACVDSVSFCMVFPSLADGNLFFEDDIAVTMRSNHT